MTITRPPNGGGILRILVFAGAFSALAAGPPPGSAQSPARLEYLQITTQETGVRSLFQAISPVSENVVWISGHRGTYGRTTDGGATWEISVMPGAGELQFRDVDAFDARTAYLLSAGAGRLSRIYRTDDAGATWTLQLQNEDPEGFFDCMAFWDRDHGIAYGDEVDGELSIFRTEDGGSHWLRVTGLPALDGEGGFAASGTCALTRPGGLGWIAAGNAAQARAMVTRDHGATWKFYETPIVAGSAAGLTTIAFWDDERGIALGGQIGQDTAYADNVAVTSDGGRTWTLAGRPSFPGPVYGSALVMGAASPTVFAVGPQGMSYSEDAGATWNLASDETFWAVAFASERLGWAVGPEGRVVRIALAGDPLTEGYVPGRGDGWERRDPAQLGFDPKKLQAAIDYANAHETTMPLDLGQYLRDRFEGQPFQEIVGPTRKRGGVNGIVLKGGYIVAEWGDTRLATMTFSVTKSYLSTVAGVAWDRGLIADLEHRIGDYVQDGTFDSDHNRPITWHNLLQQTSEWEGELWGKPDRADRRRGVDRTLEQPGTFWEYNDVRVNLMAYSLLNVWREPLPAVLKREIMDPIGASTTWRWHGYETSYTTIDGNRVQSVSGGGHWGGGMIISTRDHARFGLLFLRGGEWGGERLISRDWIQRAVTPTGVQPNYGYMWWLNTGRAQFPSAPESSYFALGAASTSVIWVDPEHDIVAVTRWVDGGEHVDRFMSLVLEALER